MLYFRTYLAFPYCDTEFLQATVRLSMHQPIIKRPNYSLALFRPVKQARVFGLLSPGVAYTATDVITICRPAFVILCGICITCVKSFGFVILKYFANIIFFSFLSSFHCKCNLYEGKRELFYNKIEQRNSEF